MIWTYIYIEDGPKTEPGMVQDAIRTFAKGRTCADDRLVAAEMMQIMIDDEEFLRIITKALQQ